MEIPSHSLKDLGVMDIKSGTPLTPRFDVVAADMHTPRTTLEILP